MPQEVSLDNVVKVSWRLSDALGYVAFPPDKAWSYDELVAFLPNAASFADGKSQEEFKASVDQRVATFPM